MTPPSVKATKPKRDVVRRGPPDGPVATSSAVRRPGLAAPLPTPLCDMLAIGDSGPARVARCHERGIRVMPMACTVGDAKRLEASGVDVIAAQGSEAGGHRSTWVKAPSPQAAAVGTMVLVPEVVDAVRIP